ncbi:dihydroorotate dehydrogenase [bacterium]|nr:MAG: dihydroorotate dehydrogenase [bacterium]
MPRGPGLRRREDLFSTRGQAEGCHGPGVCILSPTVDLRFSCGPVQFANPVFTASGAFGYGIEYLDVVDVAGLGGIVTKTLTVEPRAGNPQPRVRELRHGMLNSIGLENVGLAAFVGDKLPVLREHGIDTVVSLAAREESEFSTMITELSRHDGWKAVELNLSCPNVARGGLDFGRDPHQVERITQLALQALPDDRALWVKLTPNVTSIGGLARGAEQGGAHAISCINTVVGLEIDLARREPVFPRATAGYSGPAILPIALAKVWEVANTVSIPIVGIGGIGGIDDVLSFFVAGASAVQVGTSLFARPDLGPALVQELAGRLADEGFASASALRSERLPTLSRS